VVTPEAQAALTTAADSAKRVRDEVFTMEKVLRLRGNGRIATGPA
jgi:hypothetical protein